MTTIEELGRRAKQASRQMNRMGTTQKNQILALAAQALVDEQEEILKANAMDIKAAREKNMPEPMVDRLALSESRIAGMAEGLTQLIAPNASLSFSQYTTLMLSYCFSIDSITSWPLACVNSPVC